MLRDETGLLRRPSWLPGPLGTLFPPLAPLARWFRSCERRIGWMTDGRDYCATRSSVSLSFRVKKHQSILVRRLAGADPRLQRNKARNLAIVVDAIDGVVIEPGQTFSFWKLLGAPTRRRGFVEGMQLVNGEARSGIGGGICQASNLIFWLALHSPLTVVERYHHSFDPFPDNNRVLPYASGATVLYPYRDLRLTNPKQARFQLRLWLDKKRLNGDLRSDQPLEVSYKVLEKNHCFEHDGGRTFRRNELWRRITDKTTRRRLGEQLLVRNRGEVKYILPA